MHWNGSMVTKASDTNSTSDADVSITKLWTLCHGNNGSEPAKTISLENAEDHVYAIWQLERWKTDMIMDTATSATYKQQFTIRLLLQLHMIKWIKTIQYYELQWTQCQLSTTFVGQLTVFTLSDLNYKSLNQQRQLVPCELPKMIKMLWLEHPSSITAWSSASVDNWTTAEHWMEAECVPDCRNSGQHDNCPLQHGTISSDGLVDTSASFAGQHKTTTTTTSVRRRSTSRL